MAEETKQQEKIKPQKEEIPQIFKDSFFIAEKGAARRAIAFPVALIIHVFLVASIIIVPLLSTQNLPTVEIYSAFLAPPPPPPPPP
ncbi:MAG: hypothetical protein E3J22_00295, partial [Candidatus Aminicenantes bacterium]